MKGFLTILVLFFLFSNYLPALSQKNKPIKTLSELKLASDSANNYNSVKSSINELRLSLQNSEVSKDSLSALFKTLLVNRIIPYWEGTVWSFNGYTSNPKQGEIACGYFISTTLQDVGLRINRYKLAQQSPINEGLSLALNSKVLTIINDSLQASINTINKLTNEGIYFIGFDTGHVGYLLKQNEELYLIHSNYEEPMAVCIERVQESVVFASYEKYYLVEISTNNELLDYWVNGKEVKVVTGTY